MASAILSLHPLQTLSLDSDLSVVLELEDPLLMDPERLEELIRECANDAEPAVWGYLCGLLDQRRWGSRH